MNKFIGSLWAKILACVLVIASTLGIIYGVGFMIAFGAMNSSEQGLADLKSEMRRNLAQNYAAMMLNNAFTNLEEDGTVADMEPFDQLNESSLIYTVVEDKFYLEDGELTSTQTLVYDNGGSVDADNCDYSFGAFTKDYDAYFSMNRFYKMVMEAPYITHNKTYRMVDKMAKELGDDTLPSKYVQISAWDNAMTPELTESDLAEGDVEDVTQLVRYAVYMKYKPSIYSGTFACGVHDWFGRIDTEIGFLQSCERDYAIVFTISLIVFILSLIFLCCSAGHRPNTDETVIRTIDRMPYGIYLALVCVWCALGVTGGIGCGYGVYEGVFSLRDGILLGILVVALTVSVAVAFVMSTAVRIKVKKFWRYTILYYLVKPFRKMWGGIKSFAGVNRKLSTITAVVVGAISLLELIFIAATGYDPEAEVLFFFLYKLVEIPLLFWIVHQMEKIRQGGRRVAAGDYSEQISTEKMLPPFKEHAENINNVSQGIAKAVEEQMKSERMKTELITNVSHDIKTPLTSIINYVDLIKKAGVEDATVAEYLDVLDRQSARLKKLIEDLMEASKASTGNLEVHMEPCDVGVMISQVVGEYQEKLQSHGIEVIVNSPDAPMNIMADGRHLSRVLDNIMSNINKYAMDNTRVYVDVEVGLHQTKMTFKNVSKYPLNISSDELMERFVRGDSSRNTEGNGLGLSIAQSLTELMGGNLELDIDGDLFKVTVTVAR
ncbi:MAG: HAMP domain-containing sensor histidine kinase [Lachnospiraceae bacterium]|nr:HAMP domain-containing sensor histidine kinase [Lachnospiraceae bacterium]